VGRLLQRAMSRLRQRWWLAIRTAWESSIMLWADSDTSIALRCSQLLEELCSCSVSLGVAEFTPDAGDLKERSLSPVPPTIA